MYKELCSVIAFYLCDFTLNYLRYGNYKSYQHVTSACPAAAVSKADGENVSHFTLEGDHLTARRGLSPGSAQSGEGTPGSAPSPQFTISMRTRVRPGRGRPGFRETPALQRPQ